MVIECSSCHARFKLADDKIKETGTKVRCTKCREVFTVYPEKEHVTAPAVAPQVPLPTEKTFSPVAEEKKELADDLFEPEQQAAPSPVAQLPVTEKDNPDDEWSQEATPGFSSDVFTEDSGSFDLDAINFDNLETPVFSVTSKQDESFEFSDDTAFSFSDFSLEEPDDQKIKDENLTGSVFGDIKEDAFDEFATDHATIEPSFSSEIDLNQPQTATPDEFSFSGGDDISGFSWEEAETGKDLSPPPIENRESKNTTEESGFDFSSFSFDEEDTSTPQSAETSVPLDSMQEASISLADEHPPAPSESVVNPPDRITTQQATERQPPPPRPNRPVRPRPRKKKSGSSRRLLKYLFLILLIVAIFLGIMNRDVIHQKYKIFVGSFIEQQTKTDISGNINLVKLSAGYILNQQEGELFVIRGEAVNEFKGLRSSVLVKGTIYGEKGLALQSQSAYCGNPLPDTNLKKLGYSDIRNRMSNELGDKLSNLNIAPGKGIPCTIVFKDAPKDIKEFTVEVVDSKPGSQ